MLQKAKTFFNKFSRTQKIIFFSIFIILVLSISVGIPSLARYANRHTIVKTEVWDGTIAEKYKTGDGTEEAPFIISNGAELAYFKEMLKTESYEGKYFKLSADIILNDGVFMYEEENGVTYSYNDINYYIEKYTNKIYIDREYTTEYEESPHIKIFKPFESLENFKGYFDGNFYTIKGLYISKDTEELALFTNLSGNVSNLYLENTLINGGNVTGGIASISSNNIIENSLVNGYIIGNSRRKHTNDYVLESITIDMNQGQTSSIIDLDNKIPYTGTNIEKITLTGEYTSTENTTIKINNNLISSSNFEVDLTNEDLTNIIITSESNKTPKISLFNLKLNIISDSQITAGIVGITNNSEIKNIINKATIYGGTIAAGLIGANSNKLIVTNSYNNGLIKGSLFGSGIIGSNERNDLNLLLENTYNTELITAPNSGALIGTILNNNGKTEIKNNFNISINNEIGNIINSNVEIINSYYSNHSKNIEKGTYTGEFKKIDQTELFDQSFINDSLLYKEFSTNDNLILNPNDVWIYDFDALPILYIDDIKNPAATIFAGTYSWNNYSNELNAIKFKDGIKFTINLENSFKDNSNLYYYIHNSNIPLSKEELNNLTAEDWKSYYGLVNVETSGVNIVYVKIEKNIDSNNKIVTYINTDKLVISDVIPTGQISVDNHIWDSLVVENLETIYIDRPKKVKITAESILEDFLDIKYYISTEVKMISQIESLPNSEWLDYNRPIEINEIGKYIIYAKITDTSGSKIYLNSSFIEFDGYFLKSINSGKENINYKNLNITEDSSVTLNFTYNKKTKTDNITNHFLLSNKLLPDNTHITLIDNRKNLYYEYTINNENDYGYETSCILDSCDKYATYDFTLFNQIGTNETKIPFTNESYYSVDEIIENFTIIVDFKNTVLTENIIDLELSLKQTKDNYLLKTIYTTQKQINIYKDNLATSYLTTDYNGDTINLNTELITNINISSGLHFKETEGNLIYDTKDESKKMTLNISLYDEENNIVSKEKLNNIYFQIGDIKYYPENDNIVRIDLGKITSKVDTVLSINVLGKTSDLKNGNYYFKIENYLSDDGLYVTKKLKDSIIINSTVTNKENIKNNLSINLDINSRIVERNLNTKEIKFDIENPKNYKVRVSLYKKNQLTAYNQDYSIIDLNGYISNELNKYSNNIYDIKINENNQFIMKLKPVLFESTGYKFVFLIYEDNKVLETIEKYIIVK